MRLLFARSLRWSEVGKANTVARLCVWNISSSSALQMQSILTLRNVYQLTATKPYVPEGLSMVRAHSICKIVYSGKSAWSFAWNEQECQVLTLRRCGNSPSIWFCQLKDRTQSLRPQKTGSLQCQVCFSPNLIGNKDAKRVDLFKLLRMLRKRCRVSHMSLSPWVPWHQSFF